jgi:hypothetical protein
LLTPYASYDFDGNALDSSANGFNGTINSATAATDRFGNANSAMSFSGRDSISLPINYNSIQNFTVSMWLMRPQNGYSYVVANDGGFRGFLVKWGWPVDGTEELSFYAGNGNSWYANPYYNNIPNNQWFNLVGTIDSSGNVSQYINGVNVASVVMPPPTVDLSSGGNTIVSFSSGWNSPYEGSLGSIDDLQFYNTTLSSTQVSDLYAAQSVPEPSSYALLLLSGAASLWVLKRRKGTSNSL